MNGKSFNLSRRKAARAGLLAVTLSPLTPMTDGTRTKAKSTNVVLPISKRKGTSRYMLDRQVRSYGINKSAGDVFNSIPARCQYPICALLRASPGAESVILLGFSTSGNYLFSYSFDGALQFELQVWKFCVFGATYTISVRGEVESYRYATSRHCPLSLSAVCPLFAGANWAAVSASGLLVDGASVKVTLWESPDCHCLVAIGSLHERGLKTHQPYYVTVLPSPAVSALPAPLTAAASQAGHTWESTLQANGIVHAHSMSALHFNVPVAPPFPLPSVLGFVPANFTPTDGAREDAEHGIVYHVGDSGADIVSDVDRYACTDAAQNICRTAAVHGCHAIYRLALSTGDGQSIFTFGVRNIGAEAPLLGHNGECSCTCCNSSTESPTSPWYSAARIAETRSQHTGAGAIGTNLGSIQGLKYTLADRDVARDIRRFMKPYSACSDLLDTHDDSILVAMPGGARTASSSEIFNDEGRGGVGNHLGTAVRADGSVSAAAALRMFSDHSDPRSVLGCVILMGHCSVDADALLASILLERGCDGGSMRNYDARLVSLIDASEMSSTDGVALQPIAMQPSSMNISGRTDGTGGAILILCCMVDYEDRPVAPVALCSISPAVGAGGGTFRDVAPAAAESATAADPVKRPRTFGTKRNCSSGEHVELAGLGGRSSSGTSIEWVEQGERASKRWRESSGSTVSNGSAFSVNTSCSAWDDVMSDAAAEPSTNGKVSQQPGDKSSVFDAAADYWISSLGSEPSGSKNDAHEQGWGYSKPLTQGVVSSACNTEIQRLALPTNLLTRAAAPTQVCASHGPIVREKVVLAVRVDTGEVRILSHTRCPPSMQPAWDDSDADGTGVVMSSWSVVREGIGGRGRMSRQASCRTLSSLTSQAVNELRLGVGPAGGLCFGPRSMGNRLGRPNKALARELNNDAVLAGRSLQRLVNPTLPLAIVL